MSYNNEWPGKTYPLVQQWCGCHGSNHLLLRGCLSYFSCFCGKLPWPKQLKEGWRMWLAVQGYSPPWQQKLEVTRHIIYEVRKQRVVTYWTYWVQLTFFFVVQDPNPQNGVTHFIIDLSTSISLITIFPHKHGQKTIFIKTIHDICAWKLVS